MNVPILESTVEIDDSLIEEPAADLRTQLREYERGDRQTFDLEVSFPDGPTGDVLRAIAAIPYGDTRTYGRLAADLDTSPIFVGNACGRNPVPVIVPCHRVVGSTGELRGYSAADGVATKRRLLDLESRVNETHLEQTRLPTDR